MKQRVLSLILALATFVCLLPGMALAADDGQVAATRLDVAKGSVTIGADGITGYDSAGNAVTASNENGYYLFSSGQTGNTVTINCDCTIYLGGLDILVTRPGSTSDYGRPNPININGPYQVTLVLVDGTTNTLASEEGISNLPTYVDDRLRCGSGKASLRVPSGATLTIDGSTGILNAMGAQGHNFTTETAHAGGGAGIGGNGAWAASFGSDAESSGAITIRGGVVNAVGGDAKSYWGAGSAAIGGGGGKYMSAGGSSGAITIEGGDVTVKAGTGRNVFTPIGAGGSGGYQGSTSPQRAGTAPITVNGGTLTLNSSMELSNNMLTIGANGTLVISAGATLTIPAGVTLQSSGTIFGTITGEGTIIQNAPTAAPLLASSTTDSITLQAVERNANGAAAEYGIYLDGEWKWQENPEFTGLSAGTAYTFAVRYASTDIYVASSASETASFSTEDETSIPGMSMIGSLLPTLGAQVMSPFVDVTPVDYYFDAVNWAVDNGVTTGTGRLSFSPDEACTRAQAVTFLWRAAGSPAPKSAVTPFVDVDSNAYYAKAVAWAVENGITIGTSATTFSPDEACTRAQIVTFLYRAFGRATSASTTFTDVAADAYYAPAVAWAAASGVTGGTGSGRFSPAATCTRAQIVTFLYRCCG